MVVAADIAFPSIDYDGAKMGTIKSSLPLLVQYSMVGTAYCDLLLLEAITDTLSASLV